MGIPIFTYGSHAHLPGGRDFGPDEAKRYARRLGVTPEWLLRADGADAKELNLSAFECQPRRRLRSSLDRTRVCPMPRAASAAGLRDSRSPPGGQQRSLLDL
jgi:hypothetical protein